MTDRWWDDDPEEIFWLEITDRDDLGVDLHAPAADEDEDEYWSYAFVREVRESDIVLHYRTRPTGAITHWSRAVGNAYADEVVWGAHGQAVEAQSIRIRVRAGGGRSTVRMGSPSRCRRTSFARSRRT